MPQNTINEERQKNIKISDLSTYNFQEVVENCHTNVDNPPEIEIKENGDNLTIKMVLPKFFNENDKEEKEFYYNVNYEFEFKFYNSEDFLLGDGRKKIKNPKEVVGGSKWMKSVKYPVEYDSNSDDYFYLTFTSRIIKSYW